MPTYARLPVRFTRGEGAWLWDTDGKKYLDGISGIGVCSLGHAHPTIAKVIREQSGHLLHTSNLYEIPYQSQLADALTRLLMSQSDPDPIPPRVFFCNSGTEANEAAIKIARMYAHHKGIGSPKIVVTEGAFHGRTLGALSATGNPNLQIGFEPLLPGFLRVPFNDSAAITAIADNPDIVAVLVEPIQGEGGVIIPDDQYLQAIRDICDRHDWLMILDEVQTGMGRTGRWFAWQHSSGAVPDVMMLAKALGNGIPIGACLARGRAVDVLTPGTHGSTFGGNPLACRVALTVVDIMEKEGIVEHAERMGHELHSALASALLSKSVISEVRGSGLMIGIKFNRSCGELVKRALERGLLINVTVDDVLRLLPPLIIEEREARRIVQTIAELVDEFFTER